MRKAVRNAELGSWHSRVQQGWEGESKEEDSMEQIARAGWLGVSACMALHEWPETPRKTPKMDSLSLLFTGK